jgi:hypothetical protein
VSKISANNVPFGFSFPSVCGGDFVQGKFSFRQISVNNGHFTGQAIFTAEVIDSTTGQVVDRVTNPGTFIVNTDGLPTIQTMKQEIAGSVFPIHFVFVTDEQGNFHVHP